MENELFDYVMYQVTNSCNHAVFSFVEEGDIPPLQHWPKYEEWMQTHINELRQTRELGQILVFMTRIACEGAITGLELPRDVGHGAFRFLV